VRYTINAAVAVAPWVGYHWFSWSFESTVLVYLWLILYAMLNHQIEEGER